MEQKSFSVSSLNLQIQIQAPKFSWDSLLLNFVQINFIRLNVRSTSAVDGGINAAKFKILVLPDDNFHNLTLSTFSAWPQKINLSFLSVSQSWFLKI